MSTESQTRARAIAQDLTTTVLPMLGSHAYEHLEALEVLTALQGELTDLIAGEVAVARAQGAEWQHIANALGVTKQAAHKRYA